MPDEFPDLPNEMWQKIIADVPPSDLQAMRATSRVLRANVDDFVDKLVSKDELTDNQGRTLKGQDADQVLNKWAHDQATRQQPPDYTNSRLRYDNILSSFFNNEGTRANLIDGFYNMDRDTPQHTIMERNQVQDYIDWLVKEERLLDHDHEPPPSPIRNYQALIDSWGQSKYHWTPSSD